MFPRCSFMVHTVKWRYSVSDRLRIELTYFIPNDHKWWRTAILQVASLKRVAQPEIKCYIALACVIIVGQKPVEENFSKCLCFYEIHYIQMTLLLRPNILITWSKRYCSIWVAEVTCLPVPLWSHLKMIFRDILLVLDQ